MTAIAEARVLRNQVLRPLVSSNSDRTFGNAYEYWPSFGRNIDKYLEDFFRIVDRTELLHHLGSLPKVVAVDFCSGPQALESLFYSLPQLEHLGVSVGLTDAREERQRQKHEASNIHHIAGDILDTRTWSKLRRSLSGQKADLIVETAMGALVGKKIGTLPLDKRAFALMINRAWNLLTENNGTMLLEVPRRPVFDELGIDMVAQSLVLNEAGVIFKSDITYFDGFVRLTKTPDSPKRLPLLA